MRPPSSTSRSIDSSSFTRSGRGMSSITFAVWMGDGAERGQRKGERDAGIGQHLLRGDLPRLRTQVEALDLDLAADRPERMPARRESLDQPALDEQQARLVVLDHVLRDQRV